MDILAHHFENLNTYFWKLGRIYVVMYIACVMIACGMYNKHVMHYVVDRCMHHTHDGCTNNANRMTLCIVVPEISYTTHTLWSNQTTSMPEMCCDMHISVDLESSTAVLYPWKHPFLKGKSNFFVRTFEIFSQIFVYRMPNLSSACCNMASCSVPQICPPSRISPPCIFSTKSCWGIFIPHLSLGCLQRTQTARINDRYASYFAEVPCFLDPQDWSSSGASGASLRLVLGLHPPPIDNGVILYRKGGRNRVRKKLSHPAYKPPHILY